MTNKEEILLVKVILTVVAFTYVACCMWIGSLKRK